MTGNKREAQKILEKLIKQSKEGYIASFHVALFYAVLKDKNKALEWLEKAYKDRSFDLTSIKVEPILDNLHSDPRFTALLKKMGLEK